MKHTERCEEDRVRIEKERKEYATKWPSYCRSCNGWGGEWHSFDPSPGGISLSPGTMDDFEDCPECLGSGFCGRCGHGWIDNWGENGMTCPGCGADFEKEGVGMPRHECYCHELEAERMMDEAEEELERLREGVAR